MFSKETLMKVALMVAAVVIGNLATEAVKNMLPKKA